MFKFKIPKFFKNQPGKYYRRNYYDSYVVKDFTEFALSISKNEKHCFEIKSEISFGEISFGMNIKEVISLFGTPKFKLIKHYSTFDLTVLIYKDKINNNKKVSVFYFIDEVFVAGEHKFSDLSKENIGFLKRMLFKKYDTEKDVEWKDFFLKNPENAIIYYNESFYISVFYLSLSEITMKHILKEISERESQVKNKLSQKEIALLKSL